MSKYKELTPETIAISTLVKAVGKITDDNWYEVILKDVKTNRGLSKTCDFLAVAILAEVVNRYTKVPIRVIDHDSKIIGYRNNFNGDFYDQSTTFYSKKFRVSRDTVMMSIKLLKNMGLLYNVSHVEAEGNKQYLIPNALEIAKISDISDISDKLLILNELSLKHIENIIENNSEYSQNSKALKINTLEQLKNTISPTLQSLTARVVVNDCNSIIYHNKSFSSLHSEKGEKKAYRISASQKSDSAVISFLSYRKISERLLVDNSVLLDLHCDLNNFGTFNKKSENLFLLMLAFLESNKECKAALNKSMKEFSVQLPVHSFINSWAMSYMSSVKTEKKCSIEHLFLQLQNYCKNNKLGRIVPLKVANNPKKDSKPDFFDNLVKKVK